MNSQLSNIIERLLENKKRILSVNLAVGELRAFQEEHWRELTQNTPLALSKLNIRILRAEQQCMACFEKYHPKNLETHCPHCGGMGAKIIKGEEFYLESIEEENE